MQSYAKTDSELTEVDRRKLSAYDQFLTFCALGGLIVSDDGRIEKMTTERFCQRVGVNVTTTWRWKKEPGFAQKVRARRDEIVPLARETIAFNRLFMIGMQSKDYRAAVDAIKTYLGHFGNLQLPTQKHDVEVHGSATELLKAAREDGIIEGELTDATEPDAPADGPDASVLSLPS